MNEEKHDTSVKKLSSRFSPKGEMGQKYLSSGIGVSMRLWENEQPGQSKEPTQRDYETVGYVISGRAELELEGQKLILEAGDSWTVPKGALHTYKILESFTAIEATHPPAEVQNRDRKELKTKDQKDWSDRLSLPEVGDQGEPGSIEQQLDMVEGRPGPRGEGVMREKGRSFDDVRDPNQPEEMDEDKMMLNYHVDLSDTHREGDESSGDEHSSGLQGGDPDLNRQPTFREGLPGDEREREDARERRGLPSDNEAA